MANHKSSKKRIPDPDEACSQPSVPQDGPQRREGPAHDHREERRRGPASEGNRYARQTGKAQHRAQEQGCEPEELDPASRERTLNLRPREERSRTETEKPHRKRAAFSVSRPARRQATSGGFGFHTNRPCRRQLRQGRFSFRERFPAPPGLPRYFRPSITAAMREKTSSIVPVPLTEAYLPCAA